MEFGLGDRVKVHGTTSAVVLGLIKTDAFISGLEIGAEISSSLQLQPDYILVAYFDDIDKEWPLGFVCAERPEALTIEED